jgi:transposase
MTRMVRGMIATLHRQGWSDVQIAAHTGVSRYTLSRWQHRDMRHLQRPTFRRFADAYVMIQGD